MNSITFAKITGFLNQDGLPAAFDEIEYLHAGNVKITNCACGRCVRARIRMGITTTVVPTNREFLNGLIE